jgi:hypothetical protein
VWDRKPDANKADGVSAKNSPGPALDDDARAPKVKICAEKHTRDIAQKLRQNRFNCNRQCIWLGQILFDNRRTSDSI